MLRRLCVALTLGILMLAALAQGAAADPSGAKNSLTFPADCGGQTVQFTVNGNGDFTPGHVVGSTAVFVLQAFDITFEFTPTGGETMSETNTGSKGNVHGDLHLRRHPSLPGGDLPPIRICHRLLHADVVAILR